MIRLRAKKHPTAELALGREQLCQVSVPPTLPGAFIKRRRLIWIVTRAGHCVCCLALRFSNLASQLCSFFSFIYLFFLFFLCVWAGGRVSVRLSLSFPTVILVCVLTILTWLLFVQFQ